MNSAAPRLVGAACSMLVWASVAANAEQLAWTNLVIPHLEVTGVDLSNVVAELNTALSALSPEGETVRVVIAESTSSCPAGTESNHVAIAANAIWMNATGMRFGQALKIIARVSALSCSFSEHGAVLARDSSHDWETQRDPTISDEEVLGIAEAVFRYQCQHTSESMGNGSGRTRCISLFNKDPTPQFLMRFKGVSPPVTQGSSFRDGIDLLLSVNGCRRVDRATVQVSGECFSDGFSFARSTFTVAKRGGIWVVVEAVVTIIG